MGCTPTLAVVLVVAVLETSDEVTAVVVVAIEVHCTCSSAKLINIQQLSLIANN